MSTATATKRSATDVLADMTVGIGRRLREVRNGLGLSQREMSERTGFPVHRISDCERGLGLDPKYVAKVADVGGVPFGELMGLAPAAEEVAVEPEPEPDRGAELARAYGELAQRCALLTAAAKLVKGANDAARGDLVAIAGEMRGLGNAPKTSDVIVNGTKVGTLTMASGKDWAVEDEGAYGDWALENGLASEHFTLDTRDLTDDQREMLEVWSHANGVELRHHVTVFKDAERHVHRIGDQVVADGGELVPGLVPCEPTYTPRMTVKDPQLAFAAIGAGNVLGIDAAGLAGPAVPLIEGAVE